MVCAEAGVALEPDEHDAAAPPTAAIRTTTQRRTRTTLRRAPGAAGDRAAPAGRRTRRPYCDARMRAGRLARLCVVPALAGIFLVATAAPAWAHAILMSTDPPKDGVAAAVAVAAVADVQRERRGLVRRDPRLHVRGQAHHDRRAAALADERPHRRGRRSRSSRPASTSSSWHVISADSHPVGGTYSFRIGSGAGAERERLRDRDERQEQRDRRRPVRRSAGRRLRRASRC